MTFSKKFLSCFLASSLLVGSCYAQKDDSQSSGIVKKAVLSVFAVAGVGGFVVGLTNGDKQWGFPVLIVSAMVTSISGMMLGGKAGPGKPCDSDCSCHNDPSCHHSLFCNCDLCVSPLDERFWNFDRSDEDTTEADSEKQTQEQFQKQLDYMAT